MVLELLFMTTTQTLHLPPKLLESVCYVESHHNIQAIHKDDGDTNSMGVCQVKLKTARWMGFKGSEKDLMKPNVNIYYAGKYLHYQLNRYGNNVTKALIGYNMGNAKNRIRTKYSDKVQKEWKCRTNSRKQ